MSGNDPAYPGLHPSNECRYATEGLTKREYFAGLAMAGVLATFVNVQHIRDPQDTAITAVNFADALLKALEAKP